MQARQLVMETFHGIHGFREYEKDGSRWCTLCDVYTPGRRRGRRRHRDRFNEYRLEAQRKLLYPLLEAGEKLREEFRRDVQDLLSQPLFKSSGQNKMVLTEALLGFAMQTPAEVLQPSWRQEYKDLLRRRAREQALSSVLLASVQARMAQRWGGVAGLRGEAGEFARVARELVVSEGHALLQLLRPWLS